MKKFSNYRLIGVLLIPLSSLLLSYKTNAQTGIFNDKEALKIICKALKYNSSLDNFGEFVHFPSIQKKRFPLKTTNYYKQLIDDKVLKVVSETNNIYTYEIEDSYKSYVISMDAKNQTVLVQTVGLRILSTWKKIEFSNSNEATAFINTEYGMSPFYNTEVRTNFNGAQGWLLKIKFIKINGVWRLKEPIVAKKQIETIKTDIQPSIENISELKTTSVIKDGLNDTLGNMPYRLYKGKGTQQIKAQKEYITTTEEKNQADILIDDILDIHEKCMVKLAKLRGTIKKVEVILDSISKLPENSKTELTLYKANLESLDVELKTAEISLDVWMVEFEQDHAIENIKQRLEYLLKEKKKITMVKEAFINSLAKADSLFK